MQRILTRGEIETLDRTSIVRLIFPAADTFATRAKRLRELAPDNPIADYLRLIAKLADAQQQVFSQEHAIPAIDERQLAQAQAHGMPPFNNRNITRDKRWREQLAAIVELLLADGSLAEPIRTLLSSLRTDIQQQPELIEQQAEALLNVPAEHPEVKKIEAARAPFIMAALQVYWSQLVSTLESKQLPAHTPFGLCPCCGSQPVSSTVMLGGPKEQIRYATCSLCSSQWHIVRVVCTHCEDTKQMAYHTLEEGRAGIKAESCDHCQHYRKIFYLDKEQFAEAFADDLASLPLDILMGEAQFYRANNNPYLWQLAE